MFVARARRGVDITAECWRFLRADPKLLIFPCVSVLAGAALITTDVVANLFVPGLQQWLDEQSWLVQLALHGGVLMTVYCVAIFLNTAMVSCTLVRLSGGKPSVAIGLRMAAQRLPQILAWGLVATLVDLLLDEAEERLNWLGKLVTNLIGAGWSLATFLVAPVLAVEGVGPVTALRRSVELLRKTWGEGLVGNFSIQVVSGIAVVTCFAMAGAGIGLAAFFNSILLVGVVVALLFIAILLLLVATIALHQIFATVLYFYATTGKLPAGFSEDVIRNAWHSVPAVEPTTPAGKTVSAAKR